MDPEVVSRLRAMRVEEWAEPAVRYGKAQRNADAAHCERCNADLG